MSSRLLEHVDALCFAARRLRRAARLLACLPLIGLLGACAVGPRYDVVDVDLAVTPQRAAERIEALQNQRVIWGGMVVQTINLEDRSLLEVVAYPLDQNQRPNTLAPTTGRFLAEFPGFLEPATYAAGRQVTVTGTLQETETGRIGDATYRYPIIAMQDTYLWERAERSADPWVTPRVHIGVGVLFRR
jgi:outer membrane lipoprotein